MLLKFIYIYLDRALSIYNNVFKEERCYSRFKGQRGHNNTNVAIDIYYKVKRNNSKNFRRELLDYIYIGRCWISFVGTSLL